jgi:hypothetical protein
MLLFQLSALARDVGGLQGSIRVIVISEHFYPVESSCGTLFLASSVMAQRETVITPGVLVPAMYSSFVAVNSIFLLIGSKIVAQSTGVSPVAHVGDLLVLVAGLHL